MGHRLGIENRERYCLYTGCRYEVHTTAAHVQSVLHLHSSCPVCITSVQPIPRQYPTLQPMSSQYPIRTAHCHDDFISTAHIHTVPDCTDHVQSVMHYYNPCPESTRSPQPISVCTPSLQIISRQYQIFKARVQLVPHLYSQCSVSTPMSSAHVQLLPIFTPHV